jgi:hypothetical protein
MRSGHHQRSAPLRIALVAIFFSIHCGNAMAQEAGSQALRSGDDAPSEDADSSPRSRFFSDSKLTLSFRNYAEHLDIERVAKRKGWVQAMQVRFESGMTEGPVGFGLEATPFVAVKLDGGEGSRNLVRLEPDGSGQGDNHWGYMGTYALKVSFADTMVKIGKQEIKNPYLDPYDIRASPPSFRGASFTNNSFEGVTLTGGTFDAVNARGATRLQRLSTTYSGIEYDRLSYLGSDWKLSRGVDLALYLSQARDVWNQHYISVSKRSESERGITWTVKADAYFTDEQGRKLQGDIDNLAASLMLSASYGPSNVVLGYQRIHGDQFFDFAEETSGIYLVNSRGLDYNAPNERSFQVRYRFDGNSAGIPGFQASIWRIRGWGVDAGDEARRNADPDAALHGLYWRNGRPIEGSHAEHGLQFRYTVQKGTFKGMSLMYVHIRHSMDPGYPSRNFKTNRVMINYTIPIF